MPWPAATKVAGTSTGMTTDLNWVYAWGNRQVFFIDDFGADPTGQSSSDSAFTAAYSAASASLNSTGHAYDHGAMIGLGRGQYLFTTGVVNLADARIGLAGQGKTVTQVRTASASGDLVKATASGSEPAGVMSAPVGGFTAYCWTGGSGVNGVHLDGERTQMHVYDIYVAGAQHYGFYLTPGPAGGFEGGSFTGLATQNCGTGYYFDGQGTSPGGTFDYTYWELHAVASATHFAFVNNVHCFGSTFIAHGNLGDSGNTGTVALMTGGTSTSDQWHLRNCLLSIGFEADSGSATVQDFVFTGTSFAGIDDCHGSIGLLNSSGTWAAGSLSGTSIFKFTGIVRGSPLAATLASRSAFAGATSFSTAGSALTSVDSTASGGRLDVMGSIQYTADSVQAVTNSYTIKTATDGIYALIPCTVASAATGVILEAPSRTNTRVTVINRSGANSITFAAQATSHVADGTGSVIAANTAVSFVYDAGTSLWYRDI